MARLLTRTKPIAYRGAMAQSFSLHPSWDRMYMSGMTVREIADYTGQPRSTVHRHLQVRESLVEDLRAVHDAAREALGPDWPSTRWQHSYKATQDFYATHGRLPADSEVAEHDMAQWIGTQRTLHRSGHLPDVKITLMDMLPGWDAAAPRTTLDDNWRARLSQLQAFVTETGHLPHYRKHVSEHEHVLGVWLHTQHQRRAEGRLLPWRLEALDAAVPGWHSST